MTVPLFLAVLGAAAAGAVLTAFGLYVFVFSARKNSDAELTHALSEASEQLLKLAESRLETAAERQKGDFDVRRQAVESAVNALNEKLKATEALVRDLERDRDKKYGSLEQQIKAVQGGTERLAATTESLKSLLSNSRTRGQWGEWVAEDILRLCDLREGVQYLRNKAQDTAVTRPDFTFLLPQDRKVHMDVKFPLDNYQRMLDAERPEEKERFKAEFLKDARARAREITKRDYINPEEGTLDFVILFIPNESIFTYLLEADRELFEYAFKNKVLMCSPSNLFALLSVIRRAHDNFHFSQATQEVVRLIQSFRRDYDIFRERFEKVGEMLEKTREAYEDVTQKSHKRLEQAVSRIDRVSSGSDAPEPEALPGAPIGRLPSPQ